jgi:lipoate---protein ligase
MNHKIHDIFYFAKLRILSIGRTWPTAGHGWVSEYQPPQYNMSVSFSPRFPGAEAPATGRLIPYFIAPGLLHMQIDRWLLQEHLAGRQPAILRFYQWSPAAISLGYHQRRYPAAWEHLVAHGQPVDLVRRPSGGRAVLHQGDLTYALIAGNKNLARPELYQHFCEFLILGWQRLGVELVYGEQGRDYRSQANCFATATGADLVTPEGYKLVGSAQLRKDGATLQHGSMRLQPDRELWLQVFNEEPLPSPVAHLEPGVIMDALVAAAAEVLGLHWQVQPLTPAELDAIQASGDLLSS